MADTPNPNPAGAAAPAPAEPAATAAAGAAAAAPAAPAGPVPAAEPLAVPASTVAEPAPGPSAVVPAPATLAADPAAKAAEPSAAVEPKPDEFPPTAMDGGLTKKDEGKPVEVSPAAKPAEKPKEGEAAKPADAAPAPAAEAPIEYAFAFPEDIKPDQVNQERLSELRTALQGEKVKPEVAQKLLDLHLAELRDITPKITQRLQEQSWDNFRTTTNGWLTELKSDEVVGGARFDTAMRTIASVIEQYLPPEKQSALRARLRATGMGNDVNLALLLHTFGAMMGKEASMIPAQEPRQRPLNRQERGLARYNGNAAPR